MEKIKPDEVAFDPGPNNKWHPIYDSVAEFLAKEAGPEPQQPAPRVRIRNKRKRGNQR